jgi:hypothetical protein
VWLTAVHANGGPQQQDDEAAISLMAWSMAHGISTLALDGVLDATAEGAQDLAERLFSRVVRALAIEPPGPSPQPQ